MTVLVIVGTLRNRWFDRILQNNEKTARIHGLLRFRIEILVLTMGSAEQILEDLAHPAFQLGGVALKMSGMTPYHKPQMSDDVNVAGFARSLKGKPNRVRVDRSPRSHEHRD